MRKITLRPAIDLLREFKARIWIRRMKTKIRTAKRTLQGVDRKLAQMGCPSWKRQQIRRDIITSDKAWIDFLELMEMKK